MAFWLTHEQQARLKREDDCYYHTIEIGGSLMASDAIQLCTSTATEEQRKASVYKDWRRMTPEEVVSPSFTGVKRYFVAPDRFTNAEEKAFHYLFELLKWSRSHVITFHSLENARTMCTHNKCGQSYSDHIHILLETHTPTNFSQQHLWKTFRKFLAIDSPVVKGGYFSCEMPRLIAKTTKLETIPTFLNYLCHESHLWLGVKDFSAGYHVALQKVQGARPSTWPGEDYFKEQEAVIVKPGAIKRGHSELEDPNDADDEDSNYCKLFIKDD